MIVTKCIITCNESLPVITLIDNVYMLMETKETVVLVGSCICKGYESIIKNCIYEQITSSSS